MAVETCKSQENHQILLFHCVSSYPAAIDDSNLSNISYLTDEFKFDVGLSDHTTSNFASVLAISLGASAIEKHFKLDNDECGPDSSFSILPSQLESLVEECNMAYDAIGSKSFKRSNAEKKNLCFRRSLYFVKNLGSGHTVTVDDIKRIRPGFGIEPQFHKDIIGKKLTLDVERGDPVRWEHFHENCQ